MSELVKTNGLFDEFNPNLVIAENKEKGSEDKNRAKKELGLYEKRMQNQTILEMTFTAVDPETRSLYARKDIGNSFIKIVLPKEESSTPASVAKKGVDRLSPYAKLARNQGKYQVIVTGVDYEKCEITVSYRKAIGILHERLKAKLLELLEQKKKGKLDVPLRLAAKIVRNEKTNRRFVVDLNGYSLLGYLPYNMAGKGDVASLSQGMVIDVDVEDFKDKRKNGKPAEIFVCSRKFNGVENPWAGIEQRYPKSTVVNFRCVKKNDGVFFAAIEGLSDLMLYCKVPAAEENIPVIEGHLYQGYISAVSEERRVLRGRVIKKLD